MYPNPLKIMATSKDEGSLWIDDGDLLSGVSISVELESYAGSGDMEITVEAGRRKVQIMMNPDAALTLADALRLYADHSKRRPVPNIVLRKSQATLTNRCAVCEERCSDEGVSLFLSGTQEPVCDGCAGIWAPELVIQRDQAQVESLF